MSRDGHWNFWVCCSARVAIFFIEINKVIYNILIAHAAKLEGSAEECTVTVFFKYTHNWGYATMRLKCSRRGIWEHFLEPIDDATVHGIISISNTSKFQELRVIHSGNIVMFEAVLKFRWDFGLFIIMVRQLVYYNLYVQTWLPLISGSGIPRGRPIFI